MINLQRSVIRFKFNDKLFLATFRDTEQARVHHFLRFRRKKSARKVPSGGGRLISGVARAARNSIEEARASESPE